MYTKKELIERLTQKGYVKEVAERVIEKLEEYRYIDDKLFAKQFFQSNGHLSKRVIQGKLIQKGVANDIISEIIEERTGESEFELCLLQAKKYLKSKKVNDIKDIQKMQASLARKGFDFDTIKKVCKITVKSEEE